MLKFSINVFSYFVVVWKILEVETFKEINENQFHKQLSKVNKYNNIIKILILITVTCIHWKYIKKIKSIFLS